MASGPVQNCVRRKNLALAGIKWPVGWRRERRMPRVIGATIGPAVVRCQTESWRGRNPSVLVALEGETLHRVMKTLSQNPMRRSPWVGAHAPSQGYETQPLRGIRKP